MTATRYLADAGRPGFAVEDRVAVDLELGIAKPIARALDRGARGVVGRLDRAEQPGHAARGDEVGGAAELVADRVDQEAAMRVEERAGGGAVLQRAEPRLRHVAEERPERGRAEHPVAALELAEPDIEQPRRTDGYAREVQVGLRAVAREQRLLRRGRRQI